MRALVADPRSTRRAIPAGADRARGSGGSATSAPRSLHDIAPRLARARDQFLEHRAEQSRLELLFADLLLRAQRNVAHRELQLIRAYATGRPRYILRREEKLAAARDELTEFERQKQERLAA